MTNEMSEFKALIEKAIKARCRDCLAGARECTFTDCALKGLAQAKGKVKTTVIKAYCRRCLNGHSFSGGLALSQIKSHRNIRQGGKR